MGLRPPFLLLLGLLGTLGATRAHADFQAAMRDFKEGRYEAARQQFLVLAELGDGASQFNLGAMALQGQGGPADQAGAVGWLMAAADNGYRGLTNDKLDEMRLKLTDEQRKTADEVLKRYGRAALMQTVLPAPGDTARCRTLVRARLKHSITPDSEFYPRGGRWREQNGFVIVELTVGLDGVPRDPEILMSVPDPTYSAAALDVWMPSLWEPATADGVPVESRVTVKAAFNMSSGGMLWDVPALKAIRELAIKGDPTAEYQIGLAATLDQALGISASQAQTLLVAAAQGGHPHAQYWVANRFMSLGSCGAERKKMPWLRAAAQAGDGSAQLALATDLLGGEPTAERLTEAQSLLEQAAQSQDWYVMKHVAALLAASPLEALRDPATAKAVADRLMKDPPDLDPQMYEAAAVAYAAHKDFWLAGSKEQIAIKQAYRLKWNIQAMQERLALYRKSQPWVGDLFKAPDSALALR